MEGLPAVGLGRRDMPDIGTVRANDVKRTNQPSATDKENRICLDNSYSIRLAMCIFVFLIATLTYVGGLGLRRTTGGRRTARVCRWRATGGSLRCGHLGSELSREEVNVS